MLPSIIKILRREGDNYTGGDAINALDKIVLPQDSAFIADLLVNKKIGGQRILLIPIYARIAKKSGIPILRKIVDDPDASIYALHYLSILGDTSIENELRALVKHPHAWRRKIAQDGLKRVEKNKFKLQGKKIH